MEGWNGISIMPGSPPVELPHESDASGQWGCGACWESKWFQWKWEGQAVRWDIAPKELLPILFALVVRGKRWQGRRIVWCCDNMAVVSVVNSGRAKDQMLMHLLWCVFFVGTNFASTFMRSMYRGSRTWRQTPFHPTMLSPLCR